MTRRCATIHDVDFSLQRVLRVTTKAEADRDRTDQTDWLARPVGERIAAVEFLRSQYVGPGARLQRVLRVTHRPPR